MIEQLRDILSWRRGLVGGLFLMAGLFVAPQVRAAGSLSLSPTTDSGSQFSVQVMLDTGTDSSIETDLVLNYDPTILNVTDVTFGTLYPQNVPNIDNTGGKLSTFSYFSGGGPGDNFQGSGVLATINFTGVAEGVSAVTIKCTSGATNDSNIIKQGVAQDILDCLSVVNGSYTVTAAAQSTPSPSPTGGAVGTTGTPTPSVTTTPTPVPTKEIGSSGSTSSTPTPTPVGELLDSGSMTPTLTLSVFGAILLMGSVILFIW